MQWKQLEAFVLPNQREELQWDIQRIQKITHHSTLNMLILVASIKVIKEGVVKIKQVEEGMKAIKDDRWLSKITCQC